MKKTQILLLLITLIGITLIFTSCSAASPDEQGWMFDGNNAAQMKPATDMFAQENAKPDSGEGAEIVENPFVSTATEKTSTLSADVDTASYTFLRKMINSGYTIKELQDLAKSNVIRTEELVNYFDYSYVNATNGEMFGGKATIAPTPWNDDTYLLVLGLKADEIEVDAPNNLVFLIDVSGSMVSADKLPLLKEAFKFLTEQLDADDTISIVTYAGSERVVLDGCKGNKKETILKAINSLTSGGSTNGEAGIKRAYAIAEKHMSAGSNNRIILASDGDLNVGISSPDELEKLVESKRDSGIFLSVLGFGSGNFRDDNMSAIAQNGNGVYHYIDSSAEAEKIFTESLLSTIHTVAKDVKFQLTFNEKYISEYRLIGYENRLLNNEDFEDDQKDAGEVGSGHTITVCYELKLKSAARDEIRNGANDESSAWIDLAIRYKEPDEDISRLREVTIGVEKYKADPDDEFDFIATVIGVSGYIRNSKYGQISVNDAIDRLNDLRLTSEQAEFLSLLKVLKNNK